jgi:hypothetical protein
MGFQAQRRLANSRRFSAEIEKKSKHRAIFSVSLSAMACPPRLIYSSVRHWGWTEDRKNHTRSGGDGVKILLQMSPRIINYESSIGSKMAEAKRLTMNARNRYHYTAKLHPLNYLQVLTL